MKKNNKKTFNLLTILLAVLAVCLLLVGGIGGTRAVLIESDTYSGTLQTPDIAVQLNEANDPEAKTKAVADGGELLTGLLADGESLAIGKQYDEILTVTNTGTAAQFVRVTLYKYWTDGKGKAVTLDPSYINLILGDGWKVDSTASTPERTVVYYTEALAPDAESKPLLKKISASSDISKLVTQTETKVDETHTTIVSTYAYDGLIMNLEASADAIQTHNAQDAIKASWGATNVTADENAGTLTVN